MIPPTARYTATNEQFILGDHTLSKHEVCLVIEHRLKVLTSKLTVNLPYFRHLNTPRRLALADVAYVAESASVIIQSAHFNKLMARCAYEKAAAELLTLNINGVDQSRLKTNAEIIATGKIFLKW